MSADPQYGIQRKVATMLNVNPSLVGKIVKGTYHPKTAKGQATVTRVLDAIRRESRS